MTDPHADAAEEFVRRAREQRSENIVRLFLFGSTVRGETTGLESDVDFLVVVSDSVDLRATADELRDIAYDVMLEFGPVIEVHVLTRSAFEQRRERNHPFVTNVVREGRTYAG